MIASDVMQLSKMMQEALATAIQCHGELTVCALDVDHFKQVNEQLGHQRADRLIAALAQRLDHYLDRHDAVVHAGGDEFVLMIQGLPMIASCTGCWGSLPSRSHSTVRR
ncbi:GGDEF domain-containing protein [Halomonas sp. BC04]|uniref:GGDEF domain-containing protein n=1 Tax=Halomonas sp. BC04 TaxID=1403540 RepID=UPI0003ED5C11|nr:GGDEF domain-containing protein [Halomonas sp. BC04]EWG99582.1 hypothetical protein Q427_24135 [Halomonas sp. BC04]